MDGSLYRSANDAICSRRSNGIGSVAVINASALARSISSRAASISSAFLAFNAMVSSPSFFAPLSPSACSILILGLLGFISSATREILGAISRRSSTRFPARTFWLKRIPVTCAPGRFMLLTSSNRTGSPPIVKTTGTVLLACCGGSCRGNVTCCGNYSYADAYKLSRQRRQCLIIGVRPTLDNPDISSLDEACFCQSLTERVSIKTISIWRGAVQKSH